MKTNCIKITVSGKVQGVAFRYHTQKTAEKLNIKGWVKNMPDGSVYIEACGNSQQLELFKEWCRKGPMMARVHKFNSEDIPQKDFSCFRINY